MMANGVLKKANMDNLNKKVSSKHRYKYSGRRLPFIAFLTIIQFQQKPETNHHGKNRQQGGSV
jgi:hypothetical protein